MGSGRLWYFFMANANHQSLQSLRKEEVETASPSATCNGIHELFAQALAVWEYMSSVHSLGANSFLHLHAGVQYSKWQWLDEIMSAEAAAAVVVLV